MNPWTAILMDLHESMIRVENGEPLNTYYYKLNEQARDDPSLTDEQRRELFYKMTEVLHTELLETMPRTKDLMDYLVEGLTNEPA